MTEEKTEITENHRNFRIPPDLRGEYHAPGSSTVRVETPADFARQGLSTTFDQIVATWGEEGLDEYREARREFEETHPVKQRLV